MRIRSTVVIDRPAGQVFAFVTTPGNWPRWHPASLGVSGATDHSLDVGEVVTERFRVAGQTDTAVWTVRERRAPERWVIEGSTDGGNRAVITYTLTPEAGGTRFERELAVTFALPLPALVVAVLQQQLEAQSAEALRWLKEVVEAEPAG
jgi:uncharacterized protein YndB with AHSA1/START domain